MNLKHCMHVFIRNLLSVGIQPTHDVVYGAIVSLKRAQDPTSPPPSKRWFADWLSKSPLHTIKTKPLATVRYTAAQVGDITEWFRGYAAARMELHVDKRQNIINFDEAGFRVGCMKGHSIIVPSDVYEVSSYPTQFIQLHANLSTVVLRVEPRES